MTPLGFKKLIKIKGKNFFNLTPDEAADMIDAYLAGGNERFEATALPEFMLVPNTTPWLEGLRNQIMFVDDERRTAEQRDGLASDTGRKDLASISRTLRE